MSFEQMQLSDDVLRGIFSHGFEKPSSIQLEAIPVILEGKDVIGQAQSGSGKTGTFSIPVVSCINLDESYVQSVVISPTRDLAIQTAKVIEDISKYKRSNEQRIKVKVLVGGTSVRDDMMCLRKGGIHIVVGTPGRICDMVYRKALKINRCKMLVLDEADEMLSIGFKDKIRQIVSFISPDTQVCMFSATLPNDILKIADMIMKEPVKILVKNEDLTLEGIRQFYVNLQDHRDKISVLMDIYSSLSTGLTIVFANSKKQAEFIRDKMTENDFSVGIIHGEMNTQERKQVVNDFIQGEYRVLVSTNLYSRGINIQQVSFVVNYDFPRDYETYLHRIGRSGRHGRKGVAVNLICPKEEQAMVNTRKFYSTQIDELPENFAEFI